MYKGQNSIRVEDLNISSVVVKAKLRMKATVPDPIPLETSLYVQVCASKLEKFKEF